MSLSDSGLMRRQHTVLRFGSDRAGAAVFTRWPWICFTVATLVFVAWRIYGITEFSLWTDEIFSLGAAQLPWVEMFPRLVADKVHPPLFYVLLKIWIEIGGQSLLWLKLFPFFIAAASIVPFHLLCRKLNISATSACLALFLMAVNGYLVYYAHEIRMYGLLLFFTLVSFLAFVGYVNRNVGSEKQYLIFLFLANLLLIYTHYFGWLVVGTESLFLLFLNRRKFLLFSLSIAGLGLCFLPWVYLVVGAVVAKNGPVTGLDWISRPTVGLVTQFFANLTGPLDFSKSTFVRFFAFGVPILFLLWRTFRSFQGSDRSHRAVIAWLSFSFALPLAFVYTFSIFGPKSIWGERGLLIVVPSFMLLLGIALDTIRPQWLRTAMLFFTVTWATAGGIQYIERGSNLTRVAWQDMTDRMIQTETDTASGIRVYQFETNYNRPIQYYLQESHDQRFQTVLTDNAREVEGNHFWVAFREDREREKGFPVPEILEGKGYQVSEEFTAGNNGARAVLLSVRKFSND